jgi:DNA-binding response OmpR family regulator
MKLLLIDDNASLNQSISSSLDDSWDITALTTGREGAEQGSSGSFDIIILDLNLPDIGGHEVCKLIRRAGASTPILVLSGIAEPGSKAGLLQSGADDYVTKPFDARELRARIQALLRRGHLDEAAPYLLKADGLVLDPHRRHVERDGRKIILRRKEFDILEYLLRNRGRVVTRTMIMDNVWAADSDTWNNTVDVHIKSLRDKVDRPFKRPLISTAYGIGYTIRELRSQHLRHQKI